MGKTEIKTNLHKIVDRIEDERLLRAVHDFLEVKENSSDGVLWNSLTAEQKEEVLQAYEDSEADSKLLDDKDVWRQLK